MAQGQVSWTSKTDKAKANADPTKLKIIKDLYYPWYIHVEKGTFFTELKDTTAALEMYKEARNLSEDDGFDGYYFDRIVRLLDENADPDVKHDFLLFLKNTIPQFYEGFRHAEENSDAHLKSSLVGSSVTVPYAGGKLLLGTWQGIYIWEHRQRSHLRELVVHIEGKWKLRI